MSALIRDREIEFLLYELLDAEQLLTRPRYAGHTRQIFDASLESARRLASDFFAPHAAKGDRHEPLFENGTARVLPEVGAAWRAFADAGFLNAHWDEEQGGLQLPEVVLRAALALFFSANTPTAAYPFLTIGAANLLRSFGSHELKRRYLPGLATGSSAGTMALTEPGQGSALGDIKTIATAQPDGSYRVFGQKMFISGGDQDFTDNIVHMVLARIEGAPDGAKGISLFLVPKRVVDDGGASPGLNDVKLIGLLHKMGWRQTTSTVLNFGESGGAVGYLLGEANQGLAYMFQMMNEARIGVGLIAAALAYRGFAESLAYARERRQGRSPANRDPSTPQIKLVDHADVRRLLLAQKAYSEGALAMCLYASSLFEDQHTHPEQEARTAAALLLDTLTPVVKSWPAKYGCASNDMAIQILGGAGYTREYPLEQLYRDQRLNPIHEGAEAIHGLDLLGRKVVVKDGAGLSVYSAAITADLERAQEFVHLRSGADAVHQSLTRLIDVTRTLSALQSQQPDLALANASVYLDAFGRVTAAWMWLKQAIVASRALASAPSKDDVCFYRGKLQAAQYYFEWELPGAGPQFALLGSINRIPFDTQDAWFQ